MPGATHLKRTFPLTSHRMSVWITTPMLLSTSLFYINSAIFNNLPNPDSYSIGMTVFGVTAALSGVCFSMAQVCERGSHSTKYAGEKFLHSSMLLVQSLMVLYLRNSALTITGLKVHSSVLTVIRVAAGFLLLYVTGAAAVAWHHGFEDLNTALWENWKRRIDDLDAADPLTPETQGIIPAAMDSASERVLNGLRLLIIGSRTVAIKIVKFLRA